MSKDKSSNNNSSVESNEPKAKQILGEFAHRLTIVERLCSRLRPLRPPVCTSRRLFDYFEIPDPYHPIDYAKEFKPQVGSSALVLGENRRPVAPHSKVAPLKPRIGEDKTKAKQFRPQGIPQATKRSSPPPAPPPIPKKSSGEFGGNSKHALHKLPVRPDLQNVQEKQSVSNNLQTPIDRSIPKPPKTERAGTGNLRMRRSTIRNQQPVVRSLEKDTPITSSPSVEKETSVNRSPSAATGGGGLDDLFGFGNTERRMKIPRRSEKSGKENAPRVPIPSPSTQTTNSNQEAPIPVPVPPTPKPVNRSPSAATGGGGLDDLFGFGNSEKRMKIPRNTDNQKTSSTRPVFDSNPVSPPSDPKKS